MNREATLVVAACALVGCIPDQGSLYAPDAETDAALEVGIPDSGAPDGSDDAGPPPEENMLVVGVNMQFWFTVDGNPTGTDPNTMYVKAGTLVHFTLQSSPTEEQHQFQILIPGYETTVYKMGFTGSETHLDWTAPSTPGTFPQGVVCPVHPTMKSDAVIQ
jgi:heme/copper-type cytochrome/quinol oxidase subunit 2